MRRRITFTVSVGSNEHPLIFARRALQEVGVLGYSITWANRSEIYTGQIQIAITSNYEVRLEEERHQASARTFYDGILRDAFNRLRNVRFVCLDSVTYTHGLLKAVSDTIERAAESQRAPKL